MLAKSGTRRNYVFRRESGQCLHGSFFSLPDVACGAGLIVEKLNLWRGKASTGEILPDSIFLTQDTSRGNKHLPGLSLACI